jgi:transcriptional regulator with XRE-family HTH domain
MEFSAERLSEALKDPTVRLTGIAEVSDISVNYLYALRDGKKMPSAAVVGKLATALKKPIEYFFAESSSCRKKADH